MRKLSFHGAIVLIAALLLAGCATSSSLKIDPALRNDLRTFHGYQYLPLDRAATVYGFRSEWDSLTATASLRRGNDRIVVRQGSDLILVNGTARRLARPVEMSGGMVYLPVALVRDEFGQRAAVPAPVATSGPWQLRKVVLDAGHGGKDVGAVGRRLRLKEKDAALAIARKTGKILGENGIAVIMTRDSDTFVTLPGRAEIANKSGADIFVSIHINASQTRSLKGFECYYLSDATDDSARALEAFEDSSLRTGDGAIAQHSKSLDKTLWDMTLGENRNESADLAKYITEAVAKKIDIQNRGVKTAKFHVLKNTHIPAVLVEVGYISNWREEERIREAAFQDAMASAVADGILRYKREYERTEGFTKL